FGAVQYGRHDFGPMRGGVGIIGTYDALKLTEYTRGFFLAGRNQGKGAHAFAIERKRLRERGADQHGDIRLRKLAHDSSISLQPFAKPLVGNIKKWNQIALLDGLYDLLPLFGSRINACGVVAAC